MSVLRGIAGAGVRSGRFGRWGRCAGAAGLPFPTLFSWITNLSRADEKPDPQTPVHIKTALPLAAMAANPANDKTPTASGERMRLNVIVSGDVQGVGYRAFVRKQATGLDITGHAENMADGRVEVVAE